MIFLADIAFMPVQTLLFYRELNLNKSFLERRASNKDDQREDKESFEEINEEEEIKSRMFSYFLFNVEFNLSQELFRI